MSKQKLKRNQNIKKLYQGNGGKMTYRAIQRKYNFKSVATVFKIVNR